MRVFHSTGALSRSERDKKKNTIKRTAKFFSCKTCIHLCDTSLVFGCCPFPWSYLLKSQVSLCWADNRLYRSQLNEETTTTQNLPSSECHELPPPGSFFYSASTATNRVSWHSFRQCPKCIWHRQSLASQLETSVLNQSWTHSRNLQDLTKHFDGSNASWGNLWYRPREDPHRQSGNCRWLSNWLYQRWGRLRSQKKTNTG